MYLISKKEFNQSNDYKGGFLTTFKRSFKNLQSGLKTKIKLINNLDCKNKRCVSHFNSHNKKVLCFKLRVLKYSKQMRIRNFSQ